MRTLLLTLGLFVSACGDNTGGSGGTSGGPCGTDTPVMATASDVQTRIFQCSCVFSGCHDSSSNRTLHNQLDTMANSCASMRRMSCEFPTLKRADMANPDNSVVIKKLTCASKDCTPELGNPDVSCQIKDSMTQQVLNQRMPASDNPPLDSGRISTLKTWIGMGLPGCPAPDGGTPDGASSDAD
jgi:hypothetical protein